MKSRSVPPTTSTREMSEKKRLLGGTALMGGTVENERLQRGTVPPSPQAGARLEKDRLERNTVPPTKSTGKIREMKKCYWGEQLSKRDHRGEQFHQVPRREQN